MAALLTASWFLRGASVAPLFFKKRFERVGEALLLAVLAATLEALSPWIEEAAYDLR